MYEISFDGRLYVARVDEQDARFILREYPNVDSTIEEVKGGFVGKWGRLIEKPVCIRYLEVTHGQTA